MAALAASIRNALPLLEVQAFLAGAAPRKIIVVPGRMVNLVV